MCTVPEGVGLSHLSSLPLAVSELPEPELTPLKYFYIKYILLCVDKKFFVVCPVTQLSPHNWLIIPHRRCHVMTLRLDKNKQDFFYPGHTFSWEFIHHQSMSRRVVRRPMVHYYWPSWYSLAPHWSMGHMLAFYWLLVGHTFLWPWKHKWALAPLCLT